MNVEMGRIVHVRTPSLGREAFPAIVVRAYSDGIIDAHVFVPSGYKHVTALKQADVATLDGWYWPPREGDR